MMSKLALLLLSASLCLRASWGQDGDKTQTEEVFFEEEYGNGVDDSAVAGVVDGSLLYVAINTGERDIGGDTFGGTDLVVKVFDEDLDEEVVVQLGGDGDDTIQAIAAHDVSSSNSDIVIVGSTISEDVHLFPADQINGTGAMDWFIATLDKDDLGTKLNFVDGTEFEDQQATAVAITADGDYVVAGWTAGDYFAVNVGAGNADDDSDGGAIGFDFWVAKIDADLTDFIWSVQLGTTAYDQPTGLVVDDDFVYVVGNIDDFSDILTDAEKEEFPSLFVYCLNGEDGTTEWSLTTELGVMSDEAKAYGVVLTTNATDEDTPFELYVSGNTKGIIDGYDGNSTSSDELFIVSLELATGDVNWVYQSEGNATAFGTGGIVLAEDGLTPIISGTAFGNHFNLSSSYWVAGSGDMIAAMIGTVELEVIKYYVATAENSDSRQDPLALVKVEDEEFGVYMIGRNDGKWGKDSEPDTDDTNYLVLKVVLETVPEVEEEGSDGRDFPYWYVRVPVFAIGGVLFLVAYKWAAFSQAAKAKQATQV